MPQPALWKSDSERGHHLLEEHCRSASSVLSSRVQSEVEHHLIKTASVYERRDPDDVSLRVLISRYWPRGIKKEHFDKWDRNLAPPPLLLRQYKQGEIDFETFAYLFKRHLQSDSDAWFNVVMAGVYAADHDITFLCYEREGENCHRNIVKQLVEEEAAIFRGERNP